MRTCPPPQVRMALLLQRPGESVPRRVGTFCDDAGVALQPSGLLPGVRARFVALVPALRPDYQPRGLGIVNVPVLYAAGQSGSIGRPTFTLVGHQVVLAATETWRWEFGDGSSATTVRPGGPWPDVDVSHAYASSGRFLVRVTATWQGQFWVDGAGPFVVEGVPVTQSAALSVPVRPARAELWAPRLG